MPKATVPGALLVIGSQDVPRRVPRVASLEHCVARAGVLVPPAARGQVHGAELPLAEGVLDPGLEPPLLLLVTYLQPELNENDPAVHDVLLRLGIELEEAAVLLLRAESH